MPTNAATNAATAPGSQVSASPAFFTFPTMVLIAIALGLGFGMVYWARKWSSDRRGGHALAFPKAQLAIISIFLGFFVGVVCAVFSQHDIVVDVIAGLTTSVLAVQIGEILGHSSLSGKLESLERALDSKITYERIHSILNNLESIDQIRIRCSEAVPFIHESLNSCFTKLNSSLALIASGEIRIDDTSRELTTNKDFLLKLPSKQVCAVSYQDEKFWDDPEGIDFLQAHKTIIAHGREIHRIFVLKKDDAAGQEATIRKQMALGVSCYIVIEESIGAEYHEDFVLYDNKYVRFARLVSETISSQYKVATLSSESDRVTRYLNNWKYLILKSKKAEEFYASPAAQPQSTENA
jgi:hypothetical protein